MYEIFSEDFTAGSFDGAIATLGNPQPPISCSQDAALRSFPDNRRLGVQSFEEGAELVKSGKACFLLVPGAYPEIRAFLMDPELELVKVFRMAIPELVFGNFANDSAAPLKVLFHHRAVVTLLKNIPLANPDTAFVPVPSNEVAYESMIESGERAGCVSNRIVFEHYGHPVLQTLRKSKPMAWNVFAAQTGIKNG